MGIDCTHHRTRDGNAMPYIALWPLLCSINIASLTVLQFFYRIPSYLYLYLFIDMQCDVKFLIIFLIIIYYGALFQWCPRFIFHYYCYYIHFRSIRSDFWGLYSDPDTQFKWKMIWGTYPYILRVSTEHSGNVWISIIKPFYFNLFSFFNNSIVRENENTKIKNQLNYKILNI